MLTFEAPEPFDAAVFFESFHHCADHLAMLRRLHDIVRPGGVVLFASEPVQHLDYPGGRASTGCRCGPAAPTAGSSWASTAPTSTAPCPAPGGRGTGIRLRAAEGEPDVIVARRLRG